jgi:hypothetical protein
MLAASRSAYSALSASHWTTVRALLGAVLVVEDLVIVATWNIQTNKHDAIEEIAHVLHEFFAGLALLFDRQAGAAKSSWFGEHRFAYVGQPLKVVVAAVVEAMAIGPLIVTGDVDNRLFQLAEHLDRIVVDVIGALGTAILDMSDALMSAMRAGIFRASPDLM